MHVGEYLFLRLPSMKQNSKESLSPFFSLSHRTKNIKKINNRPVVHPCVSVGGREMGLLLLHQLDDSSLVLWKRDKEGKEDQRPLQHHVLFSVSLSSAHSSPAFSKRNVRPEVCVLYSSTQIRLVPDLGNINNSLERYVCEWECNSLLLECLGNASSGKVGQSGKIKVIGCKRREISDNKPENNS